LPDYLYGHFTSANIENFITRNAVSWGREFIPIQLSWGYKTPITISVSPFALRPDSELGFTYQIKTFGFPKTQVVTRQKCPPLGIPLASTDMLNDYSGYIRNIVQNDVREYVQIAYVDQASCFPQLLLAAVCSFYRRERDNEVF
jgi:hypothetical protein